MKVTYADGIVNFDLVEVINEMTKEEQLNLVESLSCQEAIIKFVGQQIINGWTENGSRGGRYWGSAEPSTELDKVIREIAEKSGEIAQKEIERLCALVKFQKEQTKKEHDKLFALEKRFNQLTNEPHPLCE